MDNRTELKVADLFRLIISLVSCYGSPAAYVICLFCYVRREPALELLRKLPSVPERLTLPEFHCRGGSVSFPDACPEPYYLTMVTG